MKYLVCSVTLVILYFTNCISSEVLISAKYDDAQSFTKRFEIRQAIQLVCNVSTTEPLEANEKLEVSWEKDDKPIAQYDSMKKRLSLSHNGDLYKLQVSHGNETDSGNYSCIGLINGIEKNRAFISLESIIYVKIPKDISVIEGETIKIVCLVYGKPVPKIQWTYDNQSFDGTEGRIHIEDDKDNDIPGAVFVVENAVAEDQKDITCEAISKHTGEHSKPSSGTLRVKDKYAALWPFLGICAEVIVLCAIILIYEKKRNKTELEESDTDQSPEQKNTADNGGKESNLRHRQ